MIFKTFDKLDGAGNYVKGNALFWKANAGQRAYDKGQLEDFINSQEKYFNTYKSVFNQENETSDDKVKAHKKAIASIEDANDVTKNYFKTMKAGEGTFEDFGKKQEQVFNDASKRVLSFSESTKAALKSMAAELAIALAIQAGKALWNWADEEFALTAKTKIEHMEAAVNEYNEAVSSSSENISTIKSLSAEYERLAQGVDANGRNIGLSADEFERYNQIVAELVGINPELIQGYTAEGNAIVNRNSVIQDGIALQEEYANAAKNTYASISTGQEILEGVQVNRNEVLKEMRGVGSDIYDVTAQAGGSSSFTWNVGAANGQYAQVQKYSTLVGEVLGRQIDLQNATASTYQDVATHSEEILKTAKERNLFTQEEYETLKSSLAEMDSLSLEIDTATQPIVDWLNTAIDQTDIPEHMRDGFQAGLKEISAQGLEGNWDASKIKSEALELSKTLTKIYESNEDGYATALRQAEKAQEEFMDSDRLEADVDRYNDSIESNIDLIEDLAKKYETAGDTITAAALYEEASNMADFAKENILTLAEAFNPLKDEITEARNAKETFDAAMEGGDYHTAVNAYKEIYDEVIDGFDNAGNGTMAFWQAAEQMLGTDTLQEYGYDIDKVNAKMKSLSGLLDDSSTATSNFYQMLASNQELIDEGFVTLEEDGSISFDIDDSDLDTVADKLNISKELLTSFIDSARHWTDVDLSNTGQVESAIKEMEGTFNNDGVSYQFLDTVNSQAAAAGLSVAELDRKIKSLDSVKLIDITKFSKDDEIAEVTQQFIDMNSVLGSKDASGNFSMNADAIIRQMEGMGRTADETAEILERLSEKGWIDEDSFDMDKNQTWDDYVTEMYGTLESTDPFAGMVSSIDRGTVAINDLVIAIGGIPTDIDFAVNTDEVESAVNQLVTSDSYTKGDKAKVQGMIDAQRNRNNRLRENALALGYKEDSQYIKDIDASNQALTEQEKILNDYPDEKVVEAEVKINTKEFKSNLKEIDSLTKEDRQLIVDAVTQYEDDGNLESLFNTLNQFPEETRKKIVAQVIENGSLDNLLGLLDESDKSVVIEALTKGTGDAEELNRIIGLLPEDVQTTVRTIVDDSIDGLDIVNGKLKEVEDESALDIDASVSASQLSSLTNQLDDALQKKKELEKKSPKKYGNLDLYNRPINTVEFGENHNYETLKSETFNLSDFGIKGEGAFNVTPILPDGTKLEGQALTNYIEKNLGNKRTLKQLKKMDIFAGSYDTLDEAEEAAVRMHEESDAIDGDIAHLINEIKTVYDTLSDEQKKALGLEDIDFSSLTPDEVYDVLETLQNANFEIDGVINLEGLDEIKNLTEEDREIVINAIAEYQNDGDLDKLNETLDGLPANVQTDVYAFVDEAIGSLTLVDGKLQTIDQTKSSPTVDLEDNASKTVNAIVSKLNQLSGKIFSATVNIGSNVTGVAASVLSGVLGKSASGTSNRRKQTHFPSMATGGIRGQLGPNGNGGPTLTGELGTELVWIPSESRSYLVGQYGPEVVNLPSDAVVYPADETRRIVGDTVPHNRMRFGSMASGNSTIKGYGGSSSGSSSSSSKSSSSKSSSSEESAYEKAKKELDHRNWWTGTVMCLYNYTYMQGNPKALYHNTWETNV